VRKDPKSITTTATFKKCYDPFRDFLNRTIYEKLITEKGSDIKMNLSILGAL
jgi:hypothetical protein